MDDTINASSSETTQTIAFRGQLGSFVGLAIINLLLTIVTLGIYRFWAKTRVRHFLWENTSFAGDPLEYRGKGLELLVGAILGVVVIAIPFVIVQMLAATLIDAEHPALAVLPTIVVVIGVSYLVGVGMYRSERYILSRTSWRGIRGGMTRGGWRYGLFYFGLQILRGITLGLASPYVATRLWNMRMNDVMFGSARVEATARWQPLFWRFVFTLAAAVVIYITAIRFLASTSDMTMFTNPRTPPDMHVMMPFLIRLYATIIVAGLLVALASLNYHAAYYREIWGSTRIGTLGLAFTATTVDWLRYYIGNALIVVLTLGLGFMTMPWRAWSFYTRHLRPIGSLDVDGLMQTRLAAPTQGEGIADALGFTLLPF